VSAYYNEIDKFAAQWLRNLIAAGHIAPGDVDERSIVDVRPDDLRGYTQCHFFAGIGGWSYALRLAGVPDSRSVWTGSCPCQPFSAAGKGKGAADERHLWPAWFRLIRECGPPIVFGEQVAAAISHGWLDAVFADLEAQSYACGATVLPACSVGAPHIRQRLWFVADSERNTGGARRPAIESTEGAGAPRTGAHAELGRRGDVGVVGHAPSEQVGRTGQPRENFWGDCIWLPCIDGKARPTKSGLFPLAHGVPARVGKLRAAGNAIVPQLAAEFVRAYVEAV
jgi:DNA (cytosine-5)-methyltransferase 1